METMPSIQKVLSDAKDGTLTIQECVAILHASEGVAANSVWGAPGHPLQHSAQVPGSPTFRRIEDTYHFRGPVPIQKELKGGPNAGHFKAAIKIEDDGSVTPKSNTFHSQFEDDDQAGMCLKLALCSKAGRWGLELLKANSRVSVTVTFGMPGGTKYLNRASHLVGAGIPTSNIIQKSDMESTYNFVLIDRVDMGSVVATLRVRDSPAGHLHVQTLYPTADSMSVGQSKATVTAREPTDYAGPGVMEFA